jgi:DNA-binding MarR family transcriptional regulator
VSADPEGRHGIADRAPETPSASVDDPGVDPAGRAPFALGQLLRSAHHRASAATLDRLRPLGLELRHVAAMIELAAQGPISQRHLVEASDMDKATLVRVLDDLEHAGLATRRHHPHDRRVRLVSLTEHGDRTMTELRAIAEDAVTSLTAAMPPERAALLIELLAEFCAADQAPNPPLTRPSAS